MADFYQPRQAAPPPQHQSSPAAKRPRADPDFLPSGAYYAQERLQYLPPDDNRADHAGKDTKSIEASYERYLQNAMSATSGGATSSSWGLSGRDSGSLPDPAELMHNLPYGGRATIGGPGPRTPEGDMYRRGMGFDGYLPMDPMKMPGSREREMPLPPDASNTVFVEGLPHDSTEREVAHIFRPFLGYRDIRLVKKDPKYRSGEPIVLCFIDFTNAASAATAITALQGYKFDEHDPRSPVLRLQFARNPPSRPTRGFRGKR